jgi:hypothetical protein
MLKGDNAKCQERGREVVKVHIVSKEEAQVTRQTKTPGVRRQRMNQFDEYARALLESPEHAVVYEEIGETPQKFVLSLRGAFKRAGQDVVVRKMRARDEVRAWIADQAPEPVEVPAARGRRKKAS